MKSKRYIAVTLIFVVICVAIGYHFSYPIKLNRVTLPKHITDYYNQGHSVEHSPAIVLYDSIGIGNKEYNLIEIGDSLGYVTLKEGLTGRHKIVRIGYGSGNFWDGIIKSGEKRYLLFGGRDITKQISIIRILIDGSNYDLHIQNPTGYFLLCTEIDNRIEDKHVDRNNIIFYNEKGEDITELYDLSGGGIQ